MPHVIDATGADVNENRVTVDRRYNTRIDASACIEFEKPQETFLVELRGA